MTKTDTKPEAGSEVVDFGDWIIFKHGQPAKPHAWRFEHKNLGGPEDNRYGYALSPRLCMHLIADRFGYGFPQGEWSRGPEYTDEGLQVMMHTPTSQMFKMAILIVLLMAALFIGYDQFKRYQDRKEAEAAAEAISKAMQEQQNQVAKDYLQMMKGLGYGN